jgi:hypothetical protein
LRLTTLLAAWNPLRCFYQRRDQYPGREVAGFIPQ